MKLMIAMVSLVVIAAAPANAQQKAARPIRFWAAQNGPTTITVSWDSVPGATGYRFYTGDAKLNPKLTATAASNRFHWIVNLPPGSAGQHKQFFLEPVMADGSLGERIASNEVVVANATQPAVPPASVKATEMGDSIVVTWPAVPGATAYAIGRAVAPGGLRMICQWCPTTGVRGSHADDGRGAHVLRRFGVPVRHVETSDVEYPDAGRGGGSRQPGHDDVAAAYGRRDGRTARYAHEGGTQTGIRDRDRNQRHVGARDVAAAQVENELGEDVCGDADRRRQTTRERGHHERQRARHHRSFLPADAVCERSGESHLYRASAR